MTSMFASPNIMNQSTNKQRYIYLYNSKLPIVKGCVSFGTIIEQMFGKLLKQSILIPAERNGNRKFMFARCINH